MIPMQPFSTWLAQAEQHHRQTGRPLVSLCYAQSLDGCLTARRGQPTALSGPESLSFTHWLRASHDALLAGVGTVLADDPLLTVRLVEGKNPQPVILDSRLLTPPQARLLTRHHTPAWIATAQDVYAERHVALQSDGARLLHLPLDSSDHLSLPHLLDCLGRMGIRRLMVEGGAQVITSFLAQGLADLCAMTIVPRFLGGLHAVETTGGPAFPSLTLPELCEIHYHRLGDDMIIMGKLTRLSH